MSKKLQHRPPGKRELGSRILQYVFFSKFYGEFDTSGHFCPEWSCCVCEQSVDCPVANHLPTELPIYTYLAIKFAQSTTITRPQYKSTTTIVHCLPPMTVVFAPQIWFPRKLCCNKYTLVNNLVTNYIQWSWGIQSNACLWTALHCHCDWKKKLSITPIETHYFGLILETRDRWPWHWYW